MKTINPKKQAQQLTEFIKNSFQKEEYSDALIAVSGGIDSAVSLTLAVRALGSTHVHTVLLPYGVLNDQGTKDAKKYILSLNIPVTNIHFIDIQPMVDAVLAYDKNMDEGRRGNVMARTRMVVLYDLAKKMEALVVGTENRTEHLLGYYTRFGDEASDIEPIRNLYKFQVYELARYIHVPIYILNKAPSAGLWLGQTDEGEFGFTYKEADEILFLMTEKKYPQKKLLAKGYKQSLLDRLQWWIDKGLFKARLPIVHCER
jgi:NAD+ synthase